VAEDESLDRIGEAILVIAIGHESAARCTSALALPIAMERPLRSNTEVQIPLPVAEVFGLVANRIRPVPSLRSLYRTYIRVRP
jgi:hypothetical protein